MLISTGRKPKLRGEPPSLQRKQALKAFNPSVAAVRAVAVICKQANEFIFIRIIINFLYRLLSAVETMGGVDKKY